VHVLSRGFFFLWRKCVGGTHVYSSCACCRFTLYSSIFFFFGLLFATTWTLACRRSALLLCYNLYARARTFISVLPRISAAPFPSNEQFSSISFLPKLPRSINHSSIPHSIPHTLYIYSHFRRRSPLVLFSHFYCLVVRPALLLSPWEQPFVLSAPPPAPLPSPQPHTFFFENFSHTISSFLPTPRALSSTNVNLKKSALAPLLRLGAAAVETDHV